MVVNDAQWRAWMLRAKAAIGVTARSTEPIQHDHGSRRNAGNNPNIGSFGSAGGYSHAGSTV